MKINQIKNPIEILLCEDNLGDVYIIRSSLRESKVPYHVFNVTDGEEAIAYLRQQGEYQEVSRPNLLLLDLNLPKKNGFEVLEEIKSDPELKTLPVIILTSSSAEQDILKSYQLYASSYVTKPFDYLEFFEIVKTIEIFWLNLAQLPLVSTNNS